MVYRGPEAGPVGRIAEERRGREVGLFCLACGNIYALFSRRHRGKPVHGKDHVSSPCVHEGQEFREGAEWWQPAVEVLPGPPQPAQPGN